LSIIDSLSAGYRLLARRLELILIPVLLDLLLWFMPQLSVAPLFQRVAQFYAEAANLSELPGEMATMAHDVATVLNEAGASSNLFNLLFWISGSLLHLPSLLYVVEPPRVSTPQEISALGSVLGLGALLVLAGIAVGVAYLTLLARGLPIGAGVKSWSWAEWPRLIVRRSLQIVAFLVLLVLALLVLFVPVSIGMTLLALLAPGLTTLLAFVFGGLVLVLFFYLYFVPAGLILDDLRLPRAVVQSFQLVRANFWATVGLFLLTELISIGFSVILGRLVAFQPLGTLTAIVVHAFIGSGLALAFLIFYRTRLLLAQGEQVELEL
jgi:hypothetical protein